MALSSAAAQSKPNLQCSCHARKCRRISTQPTFRLACTKQRIDRKLLSSTLRASKKGRLGFVLAAAGLFQHPRDSFSHDVWNVVRKQMVSRTLDLLPDDIPEHVIEHG
jgi:hypothetical protein